MSPDLRALHTHVVFGVATSNIVEYFSPWRRRLSLTMASMILTIPIIVNFRTLFRFKILCWFPKTADQSIQVWNNLLSIVDLSDNLVNIEPIGNHLVVFFNLQEDYYADMPWAKLKSDKLPPSRIAASLELLSAAV